MVRIVKDPGVRRQEIVDGARTLFQGKGFAGTSMADVMNHLKIARGTIYHYFRSKEELLEAVVEQIVLEEAGRKVAFLENSSGTAIEKMHALLKSGSLASQNGELLDQLHKPGNVAMHIRLLAVSIQKEAEIYAMIMEQGVKEGLFHTNTPLECAEFIISGIQFLTDTGVHPWTPEQLARRVKAFPGIVDSILGAAPGTFNFLLEFITEQESKKYEGEYHVTKI